MFITAFYAPVIPIAILLSLVGLIFSYWAAKYNIFNKRTVKTPSVRKSRSRNRDAWIHFAYLLCKQNL